MKRRPSVRGSSGARPSGAPPPSSGPPALNSTAPPRFRLWLFRLVAVLLGPLLVLVLAELALRLGGYGHSTAFFKPLEIAGVKYLVDNDKFGLSFFPPTLARSPAPTVMPAIKPAGTCRIFLFGESAALGDPRPAFGAGRYLQALLRLRYPERKFEVVPVAMTAINSHALVDIARECTRYEGDIWLLYIGNNEMVGPYGAATVFGARGQPRSLVRLNLALQRLRLGQLLASLTARLRPHPAVTWGGMEMFVHNQVPPGDKRKRVVYDNFRANLADIVERGQACHAKVLLSTVAVNLKDCPPFASVVPSNLSTAAQAQLESARAQATAALTNGDFAGASRYWAQAAALAPDCADIQFQWASSLAHSEDAAAAPQHYQRACDEDALPFRADSQLNGLIVAQGRRSATAADTQIKLVDAAGLLARASPGQVPGDKWFYEHVHLNFDGNYQLARDWAEAIDPWVNPNEKEPRTWPSQAQCEHQLGVTDWNRLGVYEEVIRRLERPPFTSQEGNRQRIDHWRELAKQLRRDMNSNAVAQARQLYAAALSRDDSDFLLHENYAEFLEGIGQLDGAVAQWQRFAALAPHHHLGYFHSGRLLAERRNFTEARLWLGKALTLRPDLGEGWLELGKVDFDERKYPAALADLGKAKELLPEDYRVWYHEGRTLSALSRRSEALAAFRQALSLNPGYWQARYCLGEELAFSGDNQAARLAFEEVLRVRPRHVPSHLNLGVAMVKLGHLEEARQQFLEVQRLDPQNRLAAEYLKQLGH